MEYNDNHRLNLIESNSESLTIPKDFLLIEKKAMIYI